MLKVFIKCKQKEILLFLLACSNGLMFFQCAATKPQPTASQFHFSFEGEEYRIRSIISKDQTEMRNEIIGSRFVAFDYDKDMIVDNIVMGTAKLSEVQRAYDYGLAILEHENKLVRKNNNNRLFKYENSEYSFRVEGFRTNEKQAFNQFKVFIKNDMSHQIAVFLDKDADGILDEVLMGDFTIEQFQSLYAEVLNAGIKKNNIVKTDKTFLVKLARTLGILLIAGGIGETVMNK